MTQQIFPRSKKKTTQNSLFIFPTEMVKVFDFILADTSNECCH